MSNRHVFRMVSQTSKVSSLLATCAIRGNRRCGTTGVRKDFKNWSSTSPKASVTILSVNGAGPSLEEDLNRNGNLESNGEVGDLIGNWSKGKSWPSSRHWKPLMSRELIKYYKHRHLPLESPSTVREGMLNRRVHQDCPPRGEP